MFRFISIFAIVSFSVFAGGCKKGEQAMNTDITVRSSAFDNGGEIPMKYTGDGKDISPPLSVANIPDGTMELALICDDPDAPTPKPWVHWVIYGIPASLRELPENIPTTGKPTEIPGAMQGKNSWPKIGYGGPYPPKGHGVHHYYFRVYALDKHLNLRAGLTKEELLLAMKGHILSQGLLMGTYQR